MATSKSPTLFDERFGEDNGRRRVHFDLSPDGREAYWLITQRMRVVQKRRRQMIIIAPTATIASKIATSQSSNDVTMSSQSVRQLRLVVTTDDFAKALHFYRDTLGLAELPSVASPGGQVAILDAGRATLEIADPITAEFIDQVGVGRRTAGHIRVAFEVNDAAETTSRLEAAGATVLATPRATPIQIGQCAVGGPCWAAAHPLPNLKRIVERFGFKGHVFGRDLVADAVAPLFAGQAFRLPWVWRVDSDEQAKPHPVG